MRTRVTRRDAIKMATALEPEPDLPTNPPITRADAARLLAGLIPDDLPETPGTTRPFDDPGRFAVDAEGMLKQHWDELFSYVAPAERAAYQRHRAAVVRWLPILGDITGISPFSEMDEAVYDWAEEAYLRGLRDGAAFEHLRRALVGPMRTCPRCSGVGSLEVKGDSRVCPDCAGNGTMAAP
jgi:hypothetical protein